MPVFSEESKLLLKDADPVIQLFMNEAIQYIDFKILCTFRGEAEQNKAFLVDHTSQLAWPKSNHNKMPSLAIDIIPWFTDYPHVRWNDRESFYILAGYLFGVADRLNIKMKWGGTWKDKPTYEKPKFIDLPHWERG